MKPILFNTDMVRAILDGRKTVTRRVVKPPVPKPCELRKMQEGYHAGEWHLYCKEPMLDKPFNSPWGAQYLPPFHEGDTLYVRETWGLYHQEPFFYVYKADCTLGDEFDRDPAWKWHPSIHMPKEAARIFLRVTDVRAERLQDILEDPPGPENQVVREGFRYTSDFIAAWENIIKPADRDRYGWDADPWVWVIEFEKVEGIEDDG